jgi:sigma-B regulation protein RsbU (phosphoserine phosphatase)
LENLNKISKFGYYSYHIEQDQWTCSDSVVDIMGFTQDHSRTFQGWVDMIVPEDQQMMAAYFKNLIDTQERNPVLRDWQIIRPIDGQYRWITATTDFVLDGQGKAISFSGIIQDITERKLIEQEVSRLSLVAKHTSNLVVITDSMRKIVWVNESFEKLTGYSIEEVVGMDPSMFQFEKTDPQTRQYIRECLQQELPVNNVEILNRGKHGNEYWLNLSIVPIRGENNELKGYIAVESDVSERKEIDIALRDSELRMRQTMDAALDAIIIMDLDGVIRFWNQQAINIFHYSKEEAIGVLLSELIIPDQYKQAHERGMAHYRKTGEGPVLNITIEITGLRKGGIEFPIEISIVPIDQDGIRLFCAFIRDITAKKQQEQIREEAQQALKRNEEE